MNLDRLKAGLAAFIKSQTAALDWAAPQLALVRSINGDGSIDIQFQDAKYGSRTNVPIYPPFPGAVVKPVAGDSVVVCFVGAMPELPIAFAWSTKGATQTLDIETQGGTTVGGGMTVKNSTGGPTNPVLAVGDVLKCSATGVAVPSSPMLVLTIVSITTPAGRNLNA